MKNLLVSIVILLASSLGLSAQEATIKVDIARTIGDIDRNIYGVFMEPIRTNMDGLLYDPEHPLANEDGFRTDYIEAARELELTNMRWPGGNYMASYDWKDGIGPKEDRPVRRELAWNVLERNHVGTDEWLALAQAMGVESSICINAGTGTWDDARYWVEYVNSPTGSHYADLRAEYGHPEPYGVQYWHLGNEVDGVPWQAVSSTPHEYVRWAKNAANIMYFVNRGCETCAQPTFLVMGSSWISSGGVPGEWEQWNWEVIDGLITQRNVEYIAIHRYWGRDLNADILVDRSPNVYLGDWAMHFEDYVATVANQIQIAKVKNHVPDKPFHIAFTEWSPGNNSQMSTLAGALHFNLFLRHADSVKRANYTMFTSLLARNADGETYRSPFFHMFKLFSTNVHGRSLDVFVDSETFDGRVYEDIPYLDVSSSYDEAEGTVVINVVNRNMTDAIDTEIVSDTGEFVGEATVSVIDREDVDATYTFEERDEYAPATSTVGADGRSFRYSFAPHSFTQIRVGVE
jgi:alpha-N-arabinofuranosidase